MKKLKTEVRREQLIRGVLRVIARDGMQKLSVARVSREVGLVPSALYRHFRSKDAMLDSVLDYIEDRLLNNVRQVCEETQNPVERVRRVLMRHLALIRESPALPSVVLAQGVFSESARRRKRVLSLFSHYTGRVAAILRSGQKEGMIRRDVASATMALMLVGVIQPAAFLFHLSGGSYNPVAHGKRSWKLVNDMFKGAAHVNVDSRMRKSRRSG